MPNLNKIKLYFRSEDFANIWSCLGIFVDQVPICDSKIIQGRQKFRDILYAHCSILFRLDGGLFAFSQTRHGAYTIGFF